MTNSPLAANLRLLVSYGKSVSDVCRKAGVNRAQFNRYLAGQATPSLHTLRRICDYFGMEDHEPLLEHDQFQEIVRLRPPKLEEVRNPVQDLLQRVYQGDPSAVLAMGYYHQIFRPDPRSQLYYRLLLRLTAAAGGVLIKAIERYPRPAHALPGKLTYEGTGFVRSGKFYCIVQEIRHRRATWYNVMSTGDFATPRTLQGRAVGSEPEGMSGITSFPVIWQYLGTQPNLRTALAACGYHERSEIELTPEMELTLSQ